MKTKPTPKPETQTQPQEQPLCTLRNPDTGELVTDPAKLMQKEK